MFKISGVHINKSNTVKSDLQEPLSTVKRGVKTHLYYCEEGENLHHKHTLSGLK